MALKLNTTVRQIVPVLEGKVTEVVYDAVSEKFTYRVDLIQADGTHAARWFDEDQIAPVTDAPAA